MRIKGLVWKEIQANSMAINILTDCEKVGTIYKAGVDSEKPAAKWIFFNLSLTPDLTLCAKTCKCFETIMRGAKLAWWTNCLEAF
jgi:hypothetical protein